MRRIVLTLPLAVLLLTACGGTGGGAADPAALRAEVQSFLDGYTKAYVPLYYESSLAEWASNTHIVEGDDTNRLRTEAANKALAAFTGSEDAIEKARGFLEKKDQLEPLQVRQLEAILFSAAQNPATVPDLVEQRISAEAKQTENLFGFDFQLDGKSITPNELDDELVHSDDLDERLAVWESSKEVG